MRKEGRAPVPDMTDDHELHRPAPRPGASEPGPLTPQALQRLYETAASPDASPEFKDLVAALAAYETKRLAERGSGGSPLMPSPPPPRRPRMEFTLTPGRIVLLAAACVALVAGAAVLTYPDVLPGSPQRLVPASQVTPGGSATPPVRSGGLSASASAPGGAAGSARGTSGTGGPASGTAATGSSASQGAASGTVTSSSAESSTSSGGRALIALCRVYLRGRLSTNSAAYRRLVAAAGGADKVPAYCAALTSSGGTSTASAANDSGDSSTADTSGG